MRAQRQSLAYAFSSSLSTFAESELRTEAARHPNEIFDRIPGAWVSNASGQAARLPSRWNWLSNGGADLEFIPYARSSRMEFLQHFLPGTPLEENGQDSAGLLFSWSNAGPLSAGIDLEWAQGSLTEFQENPLETGSDFLRETRPQGLHYEACVCIGKLMPGGPSK